MDTFISNLLNPAELGKNLQGLAVAGLFGLAAKHWKSPHFDLVIRWLALFGAAVFAASGLARISWGPHTHETVLFAYMSCGLSLSLAAQAYSECRLLRWWAGMSTASSVGLIVYAVATGGGTWWTGFLYAYPRAMMLVTSLGTMGLLVCYILHRRPPFTSA